MEYEFITGAAGTGKTTLLKDRMADNPSYGTLCATTGIAAVNLGSTGVHVTTINSALGYYDVADMKGKFVQGKLSSKARGLIAQNGPRIILDEVSMLGAEALDMLHDVMSDIEEGRTTGPELGFVVTGDFLQLPPVKQQWAFMANCWPKFEAATTRLATVHRQQHPEYLRILSEIRRGNNIMAPLDLYNNVPEVSWREYPDHDFPGTTIFGVNKQVDRMNRIRLEALKRAGKKPIQFHSHRWGKQKGEWKLIPEVLEVTESAYVMVLLNDPPHFTYANGDCGTVLELDNGKCVIELARNGSTIVIPWVTRRYEVEGEPAEFAGLVETSLTFSEWKRSLEEVEFEDEGIAGLTETEQRGKYKSYLVSLTSKHKKWGRPYYDYDKQVYVLGEVVYMPIRLAWATTVHKSQGLTLNQIQVDMSHGFFGGPSMAYVALSRVRSPEGLTIVGGPSLLQKRIKAPMECERWF